MHKPLSLAAITFIILSLHLTINSTAHAQPDVKAAAMGDTLLRRGKAKEAIPYYDKAIKANAKEYRYFQRRGLAYAVLGEVDKAKSDYFAALGMNPDCADCYVDLGTLELTTQNYRGALSFLNSGLKLQKTALGYYRRAQAREGLGDDVEALIDYNYAIQLDSTTLEFRLAKGLHYTKSGNFDMARDIFSDVIRRAPDSAQAYYYRGGTYFEQKRADEALADLNKAIALAPAWRDPYLARAGAYSIAERHADAVAAYDTLLMRFPGDPETYYYRASARYEMEDMDGSCEDMSTSLALLRKRDPKSPQIAMGEAAMRHHCDSSVPMYYGHRGIAAYNKGDFEGAMTIYTKGLKRFPADPLLTYFRGNAAVMIGKFAEARKDYEAALAAREQLLGEYQETMPLEKMTPEMGKLALAGLIMGIHEGLVTCKTGLNDMTGAIEEVDKAIELARETSGIETAPLYLRRGSIEMAMGEYRKALADFDEAVRQQPGNAGAHLSRALALYNISSEKPVTTSVTYMGVQERGHAPSLFSLPPSVTRKSDDGEIGKALTACTRAIELNPSLGEAYLLRGYLRLGSGSPDACADLEKAVALGAAGADEVKRENCK